MYFVKALELIKDSCVLYNNRALTYLNLKLYSRAVEDAETALKLNENSLKSWLLSAKANYKDGNQKAFETAVEEAKNRHGNHLKFINGKCFETAKQIFRLRLRFFFVFFLQITLMIWKRKQIPIKWLKLFGNIQ